jgi:hypothetical protein
VRVNGYVTEDRHFLSSLLVEVEVGLLFLTFGAAQVVQFLQVAVVLELDLDFSC